MIAAPGECKHPHQARAKIDAYRYVMGFRNPAKYSQRLDVNVNQQIDISGSLTRMQQKLDAAYIDVTPTAAVDAAPTALIDAKSSEIEDLL